MFPDRRVYRHRLFESNMLLTPPYYCDGNHHDNTPPAGQGRSSKGYISITSGGIYGVSQPERFEAMGIHWMTNEMLAESFPPEYTHWLGAQVMQHLGLEPLSWPKTRAVQERMFQ
jgi:DNA (cytosine-5)-methyltransferase 1